MASSMLLLSKSRNPSAPNTVVKLVAKLAVALVPKTLSSTVSTGSTVRLVAIDGPSSLNTRFEPILMVALCVSPSLSVTVAVSVTRLSALKLVGSSGSVVGCTTARI